MRSNRSSYGSADREKNVHAASANERFCDWHRGRVFPAVRHLDTFREALIDVMSRCSPRNDDVVQEISGREPDDANQIGILDAVPENVHVSQESIHFVTNGENLDFVNRQSIRRPERKLHHGWFSLRSDDRTCTDVKEIY